MASTLSPLMRKYNALRTAKRLNCAGKKTATQLKAVAAAYVKAAVAKGQPKAEAERKARKVVTGGCTVAAGTKRKTTTKRTR